MLIKTHSSGIIDAVPPPRSRRQHVYEPHRSLHRARRATRRQPASRWDGQPRGPPPQTAARLGGRRRRNAAYGGTRTRRRRATTPPHYNNFYEFGTDKDDPAANAGTLKHAPVDGRDRGRGARSRHATTSTSCSSSRRWKSASTACAASKAGRWSIPWVGYPLAELIKRVEPHRQREVRRVRHAGRPEADARRAARACSTGPTSKACAWTKPCTRSRCSPSGCTARCCPTRTARRCALVVPWKYGFKSGKSIVKIRFVEKQPHTTWNDAAPQRVRLLFQRQPRGRPSALEPGHRAAHRRSAFGKRPTLMFNGYADQVGAAVRRHGPEEELLNARSAVQFPLALAEERAPRCWLHPAAKPVLFVACLLPLAWLLLWRSRRPLGANPAEALIRTTGRLDAALPVHHAGRDAAAGADAAACTGALSPHARPVRLLLRACCTSVPTPGSTWASTSRRS